MQVNNLFHTNLMTSDEVVQMVMEFLEIQAVETAIVVREEDVVTEVVLIELVGVQFEFALPVGVVPQWGSSRLSPSPAM